MSDRRRNLRADILVPGDLIQRHGSWWRVLSVHSEEGSQRIVSRHTGLGSVDTWTTPDGTLVTVEASW